jgi:hypothetical protein
MKQILKHRIRKAIESEWYYHDAEKRNCIEQAEKLNNLIQEHEIRMNELCRIREILIMKPEEEQS